LAFVIEIEAAFNDELIQVCGDFTSEKIVDGFSEGPFTQKLVVQTLPQILQIDLDFGRGFSSESRLDLGSRKEGVGFAEGGLLLIE